MSSDAHSTRVDIEAAERFVLSTARLLDRHRLAVLLHGAPVDPVLDGLRAYRNPDGGFGHALEPDIRAPTSEPSATMHAWDYALSTSSRQNGLSGTSRCLSPANARAEPISD